MSRPASSRNADGTDFHAAPRLETPFAHFVRLKRTPQRRYCCSALELPDATWKQELGCLQTVVKEEMLIGADAQGNHVAAHRPRQGPSPRSSWSRSGLAPTSARTPARTTSTGGAVRAQTTGGGSAAPASVSSACRVYEPRWEVRPHRCTSPCSTTIRIVQLTCLPSYRNACS